MNISDILVGVNSSALNVPLNHTNWLLDYKINGAKSYVYKDKDILHELYRSAISANDEDIQTEAFNCVVSEYESYLGMWLSKNYGLRDLKNLPNYKTIPDIISDSDVVNRLSVSDFSDVFFGLPNVTLSFITTDGLKAASTNNNIMTLLESNDLFNSNITSNQDIQTISSSDSLTLENVYVLSVSAEAVYSRYNGSFFYHIANVDINQHGTTENTSVIQGHDGYGEYIPSTTVSVKKFVKKLILTKPRDMNTTNSITYIQLDNVV